MKFSRLFLVLILLFSGCITPPTPQKESFNYYDPIEVQARVELDRDNYKKLDIYSGPNIGSYNDTLSLRAGCDMMSSAKVYQICVADYYDGKWRFYNSTYDSDGNKLEMTIFSRDVASCDSYGCSHIEQVLVDITREYLDKHIISGVRFQLSGKTGKEEFYIPGAYIKGFLKAVDTR